MVWWWLLALGLGMVAGAILLSYPQLVQVIYTRLQQLAGRLRTDDPLLEIDASSAIAQMKSGKAGRVNIGIREQGMFGTAGRVVDSFTLDNVQADESIRHQLGYSGRKRLRVSEL